MTAVMLHDMGYEVSTMTIRVWDYLSSGCNMKENGCCSLDAMYDAKDFSEKAGFRHYILDARQSFEAIVVNDFVREYLQGRTPNPCVICNPMIKWHHLLDKANELGIDYIATGHYARLREEKDRFVLSKAADLEKDQSYFLWGLTQEQLSRTILPLGGYTKPQIRALASKRGFVKLAAKRESQEICFVPDNDYRGFLIRREPELAKGLKGGDFISVDGEKLGTHQGYPFYTIGQRKGLGIAKGKPLYVVSIDPNTNRVVLGEEKDLAGKVMTVTRQNLIKYKDFDTLEVTTKIRYRHPGIPSALKNNKETLEVTFFSDVNSITPGQSAVFYEEEDVVGGGIIAKADKYEV
jgi:tRNA-specific 2-thiouridylase